MFKIRPFDRIYAEHTRNGIDTHSSWSIPSKGKHRDRLCAPERYWMSPFLIA